MNKEKQAERVIQMYQAIKYGDKYTIAEYSEFYGSIIVNDSIYGYYQWQTEQEAIHACNLLNEFNGAHFLENHQPLFESELEDYDIELVELYKAFNMIKED